MKTLPWSLFLGVSLAVNSRDALFAQGSLTPPGPPAPTMITLQQIEPRTPVSSLPYVIASPGSYYLTANLTGITGSNGITIAAGNVSLDLRGFTLSGVAGSGDGVSVVSNAMNIVIHDGNLQGWGGCGVNGTNAGNIHLERLLASENTSGGMAVGAAGMVNNCQAISNAFDGITVGDGSSVKDCIANANGGAKGPFSVGSGIVGGNNEIVSGCVSTLNWQWGIELANNGAISGCSASSNNIKYAGGGIATGNNCIIRECVANNNLFNFSGNGISTGNGCTIKDCTAYFNNAGIFAGTGCNIIDCVANNNAVAIGDGIIVGAASVVRGCVAEGNGYDGIVYGSGSFIFDNASIGNNQAVPGSGSGVDMWTGGSNSTVIHNVLGTTNHFLQFNNPTNNAIGTIESAATLNTNKDPHANFSPGQ